VPSGFSTPAQSANSLTATVRPSGLVVPNVSVGKNLETDVSIRLNGVPQSDVSVTISSNSPSLLFSQTATSLGSKQITLSIPAHKIGTDFFVQGLDSSGTATYTVSAAGYGSATGTVTLAPSGIFIAGQNGGFLSKTGPGNIGLISFETATRLGSPSIHIAAAMLDSAGNIADSSQLVAGGLSVNVNVNSSNTAVGTISPSTVTIPGGSSSADASFQPVGPGNSTLTLNTPAGFSTPAQFTAATVGVAY
jgi:hypothetical protein